MCYSDVCYHVGLHSLAGEFFPEAAQIAYKMWELSAVTNVQVGPCLPPSLDVSLSLAWQTACICNCCRCFFSRCTCKSRRCRLPTRGSALKCLLAAEALFCVSTATCLSHCRWPQKNAVHLTKQKPAYKTKPTQGSWPRQMSLGSQRLDQQKRFM